MSKGDSEKISRVSFSIDVQDGPPVPNEGARRVAKLASMRFLRERIRLT